MKAWDIDTEDFNPLGSFREVRMCYGWFIFPIIQSNFSNSQVRVKLAVL